MNTNHKIIHWDSRNMTELWDNAVQLVITSPPYWQLKDYWTEEQIWFNHSYEEYINNLNLVWNECYRTLSPWCKMCINIWDQFARAVYYWRYKVIPIRTEIIKFCETLWFDYMWSIIWQKKTTMNTTWWASIMWSFPYPRNGIIEIDYEFILIFKKPWDWPKPIKEIKEQSKLTKEEWREYFTWHWNFNWVKQDKHIAMFPEELPKRLIKMFSFVWETILDPFLWSGTTSLASLNLNRNSVWYELNKNFVNVAKEKIIKNKWIITQTEIITQEKNNIDYNKKILSLPYIFKDPIKFNKKIDPNLLKFWSKISMKDNEKKSETYRIKNIISSNILELNTWIKIKLIWVKENIQKKNEAMDYLKQKLNWQSIILKFDNEKFDNENLLLSYVYLKNKTFINAHLIKNWFASVDYSYDFKYQQKFTTLIK